MVFSYSLFITNLYKKHILNSEINTPLKDCVAIKQETYHIWNYVCSNKIKGSFLVYSSLVGMQIHLKRFTVKFVNLV